MRTRVWLRLSLTAIALILALSDRADAQASSGPTAPSVTPGQRAGDGQDTSTEKPKAGASTDRPTRSDSARDLPPFIPRLTDEDRQAAFPDVEGHAAHDEAVHSFVLLDQFEWQAGADARGINLDSTGWIGRDRNRLWVRAEGDSQRGRVGEAQAHILYGRQFSRWWDIVAGIRQDFQPGPAQTWAAVGVQGLAPYWFEIEATAYVGASGRTHARFEVEYQLLLTNRLIVQPLAEIEMSGKSDPERGIGAGVSSTDAGFRLRYEFRRELAPYVGVVWSNRWGQTADFAATAGEATGGARFVTGLRLWF